MSTTALVRSAGKTLYHYGVRLPGLWAWYWWYRIRGRSWARYYADVLDWGIKGLGVDAAFAKLHRERGILQLNYLRSHGLLPESRMLDFGCGYGRAAVHLIRFLAPDRYVGVDISRERLRIAQELVAEARLSLKRPRFIRNAGCRLEELQGLQFDYIWSYGVLGHMPWADVEVLFQHLPSIMHAGAVAFMTGYFMSDDARLSIDRKLSVKDFYHSRHELFALADRCGLECTLMDDFVEKMNFGDIEPDYDKMVRLRLKA